MLKTPWTSSVLECRCVQNCILPESVALLLHIWGGMHIGSVDFKTWILSLERQHYPFCPVVTNWIWHLLGLIIMLRLNSSKLSWVRIPNIWLHRMLTEHRQAGCSDNIPLWQRQQLSVLCSSLKLPDASVMGCCGNSGKLRRGSHGKGKRVVKDRE